MWSVVPDVRYYIFTSGVFVLRFDVSKIRGIRVEMAKYHAGQMNGHIGNVPIYIKLPTYMTDITMSW